MDKTTQNPHTVANQCVSVFRPILFMILLVFSPGRIQAQDGFCMVNGTTTGGAGGPTVTVTNGADFVAQINMNGARIIQVQGVLSIGRCFTKSDKTIIGVGTNATLLGNINISDTDNVIVRNLRITAPAHDGLTIWNSHHVWVDHCTFYDTGDGLCDMNRGSQYVTVSWCKFLYVDQLEHKFTMIADGHNSGSITLGWYTLHHNWWGSGCDQRMASSSYGRLHYYNNYWNCPGNYYASLARIDTQILSENNYYQNVRNPLYSNGEPDGYIQSSGNLYPGCFDQISPGTDTVFTPSYGYSLDAAVDVPSIVMAGAGAPGPDTVPIPPKVWNGDGGNNNLSTGDNWALNDAPRDDDVLVFAGSTRLSPYNNISSGTEFSGLMFSSDAGAFTLGGNWFKIGSTITDDSTAVQTVNADMDFSYGQDHFTPNRYFNVTEASGSLVINGDIAGDSNGYFDSYTVIKEGPGVLALNGNNTFVAVLQLEEGLVQFDSINSFGTGDDININGGGLRWASGNTTDISARNVTFQSGGATLDSGANDIVLASPVGEGGSGGLTKTGSGSITLNGNNNYSGPTTIAEGTLKLGTAGAIPASPEIILVSNAVLDVYSRSDSTLALASGQTLLGNGEVWGDMIVGSGATVSPGFSVGTINPENVMFQSGSSCVMELDKSADGTNDLITLSLFGVPQWAITYGGDLVVSNIGPALTDGDLFKLFDATSYSGSFDTITLPTLTGDLYWTNNLTIDGTLAVVAPSGPPVNTTPTNIVFEVDGTNGMTLSWPADHIGWTLEAQTNNLSTNWFPVPGSADTNWMELPYFPEADGAFFRLRYP